MAPFLISLKGIASNESVSQVLLDGHIASPLRLQDQNNRGWKGIRIAPTVRKGSLKQKTITRLKPQLLPFHFVHNSSLQTIDPLFTQMDNRFGIGTRAGLQGDQKRYQRLVGQA
jgi:hypothetical protein